MKCSLVVNQLNDPLYIDYDAEFADYIINRSKEKGYLERNAAITELDANLVMQLFSPLVLSQWLLIAQTKEPCSTISCPDGFCMAFRNVDDLLFITINGDKTETEEFLHRKLQVFHGLMRFLFGPVTEEIGQTGTKGKKAKWSFLRQMMNTWSELVSTEQSFLIEAIERLNVNQLVNEKCVESLEKSVKALQAIADFPIQHAVLLVNAKLVALYSNRSAHELRPKDILALNVLSRTLYPASESLDDMFLRQHSFKGSSVSGMHSVDENSDGGDDEYHSAPTTPRDEKRSRTSSFKSERDDDVSESLFVNGTDDPYSRLPGRHPAMSSSTSETETIVYDGISSDQDTGKNTDSTNATSLLDMYREKYPDAVFSVSPIPSPAPIVKQIVPATIHHENSKEQEISKLSQNINSETIPQVYAASEPEEEANASKNEIETHKVKVDSVCQTDPFESKVSSYHASSSHLKVHSPSHVEGSFRVSPSCPDWELVEKSKKKSSWKKRIHVSKEESSSPSSVDTDVSIAQAKGGHEGSSSQASTLSSERSEDLGIEPEASSLLSMGSRSSSVISNLSRTYPELSCHTDSGSPVGVLSASPYEGRKSQLRPMSLMKTPSMIGHLASTNTSSTFQSVENSRWTDSSRNSDYLPETIFLETSTCLFSPFNMHSVQVFPGVTLFLLSKAPFHSLADSLYQVIHNVQDLIYGRRSKLPRSRSLHVYEIINSLLAKLHNTLRRYKGRVRSLSHDIHSRWEKEDVKYKLLEYLEKDAKCPIPPELESPLLEMYKKMKELFSFLYLSTLPPNPLLLESVSQLRVRICTDLWDFREYLTVKAERNITMTSYIEEFPGLIHFIFIDRRLHQMTAPSLNLSLKEGEKVNANSYLKNKIWTMYQHMMQKLYEGYTTITMKHGDFYFSYFLWFEDYAGNPIPVQESFKPSHGLPYPGILSGTFYRDLVRYCFPQSSMHGSVYCFEMFLMHIGSVHPQYIANHAKKLSHKIWEMSGEACSHLSLL